MAAADKKDLFLFKRPPRVVSFMRLLERSGKCLTAKEPPLVFVTLGRGVELEDKAMAGPRRWDAEMFVSEPTIACR